MRFKKPDPLIILILLACVAAVIAPARGDFANSFSHATNMSIALLFFLYGARLSPAEALAGLTHWRLHLLIVGFTFLFFPLLGIALAPLSAALSPELYRGLLYTTLVPSTVQSSVAFTSIARGNVPGAIVAASLSNLLGVVLTPLLVLIVMTHGGEFHIDGSVFLKIGLILLAPFALGQLCRLAPWVRRAASARMTKIVDRGSIVMVVYSAFSASMVADIWTQTTFAQLPWVIGISVAIVIFMLWVTRFTATKLGFSRKDSIAVEFCGTKKSLASGLPMATIMFSGESLGLLIVPLIIFHQVQLLICSWLASRYAQRPQEE